MEIALKSTERFSDRVTDYLKFRPSYPSQLIDTLQSTCGLDSESVVADVGSGTGKLTELLLQRNCSVFGVEPNTEMREAAETLLGDYRTFTSVAGDSASTGLADGSIDLITAAQAFHWFELDKTKQEFTRILKPHGRVALIWNQRDTTSSFQSEYDQMLQRHCEDYSKVNHRNITDDQLHEFLSPAKFEHFTYPYSQQFDLAGFLGRLFSSSYTPSSGSEAASELTERATELYGQYATDGLVEFSYQTNLYLSTYGSHSRG
ncbi:MAG: class I SAM-dependent methyltransferase [Granulosicoccus sp.]|nr:class I SAM-dependent methyltransferase [Granulosicoccus sp.]